MVSQESERNMLSCLKRGGGTMFHHAAGLFGHDSPFIIQVNDPWPLLLIREMCAEGGNEAVSY